MWGEGGGAPCLSEQDEKSIDSIAHSSTVWKVMPGTYFGSWRWQAGLVKDSKIPTDEFITVLFLLAYAANTLFIMG